MDVKTQLRKMSLFPRVTRFCRGLFLSVGVVFALATVYFLVAAAISHKEAADFRASCIPVEGRIVSVQPEVDADTGETFHVPSVAYLDSDGREHSVKLLGSTDPSTYVAGNTVALRYPAYDPDAAREDRDREYFLPSILLTCMAGLAFILCIVFFIAYFLLRRQINRYLNDAPSA